MAENRTELVAMMGPLAELARAAGRKILEIYNSEDLSVEEKADKSPLTAADMASHHAIIEGLQAMTPAIPVLSEESASLPFSVRSAWSLYWLVDPLDGTREFIKRNGEFTVNIALIERDHPVMGVVYAPIPQWLYFASNEIGAYKLDSIDPHAFELEEGHTAEQQLEALMNQALKLPVDYPRQSYTIVGSRSHGTPELDAFVAAKWKRKAMSSSSLPAAP